MIVGFDIFGISLDFCQWPLWLERSAVEFSPKIDYLFEESLLLGTELSSLQVRESRHLIYTGEIPICDGFLSTRNNRKIDE